VTSAFVRVTFFSRRKETRRAEMRPGGRDENGWPIGKEAPPGMMDLEDAEAEELRDEASGY
jgi:hypothetical protein